MIEANYAEYRSQMKKVNPEIDEPSIYASFFKVTYGNWHIQQTPLRGHDGLYHMVYISLCDNGMVYFGNHSTDDLSDGYVGSGVRVDELKKSGHKFTKIPLEYFRDKKSAEAAENLLVNQRMLDESFDVVLNKVKGGESPFRNGTVVTEPSGKTKFVPPHAPKKFWPFYALKLKIGDELTLFGRDDVKCKVFDLVGKVDYNGTRTNLKELANKFGVFHANTLESWMYDGKSLAWRRDEIIRGTFDMEAWEKWWGV